MALEQSSSASLYLQQTDRTQKTIFCQSELFSVTQRSIVLQLLHIVHKLRQRKRSAELILKDTNNIVFTSPAWGEPWLYWREEERSCCLHRCLCCSTLQPLHTSPLWNKHSPAKHMPKSSWAFSKVTQYYHSKSHRKAYSVFLYNRLLSALLFLHQSLLIWVNLGSLLQLSSFTLNSWYLMSKGLKSAGKQDEIKESNTERLERPTQPKSVMSHSPLGFSSPLSVLPHFRDQVWEPSDNLFRKRSMQSSALSG